MPTALLLEDNETDAYIASKALSRGDLGLELVVASNLAGARAYLEAVRLGERPLPEAVFVDLCLPEGDGLDLVEWARGIPELSRVRFVVLTNYAERENVRRAYERGAHSVLSKSDLFADDGRLGELVSRYWLDINSARGV